MTARKARRCGATAAGCGTCGEGNSSFSPCGRRCPEGADEGCWPNAIIDEAERTLADVFAPEVEATRLDLVSSNTPQPSRRGACPRAGRRPDPGAPIHLLPQGEKEVSRSQQLLPVDALLLRRAGVELAVAFREMRGRDEAAGDRHLDHRHRRLDQQMAGPVE